MNKEKVQKLICKLEVVLEGLKEELLDGNSMVTYEDGGTSTTLKYEEVVPYIDDYDEVFYGDDLDV